MNVLGIIAASVCSVFSVSAGVYDDALFWWAGNSDTNGDGIAQAQEVRDAIHWDSPSAIHATDMHGRLGGPAWVTQPVPLPSRGETRTLPCLHFAPATNYNETTMTCWPDIINKSAFAVGGSATLVMRMRWDGLLSTNRAELTGLDAFIVQNAYDWNNYRGWMFGVSGWESGVDGSFTILSGQAWKRAFTITTNVWYDVAAVMTDNGDKDAVDLYMVSNGGTLSHNHFDCSDVSTDIDTARGFHIGSEAYADGYAEAQVKNAFRGDIQQLALWNRALTQEEIAEAFGFPGRLWQVGLANGSGAEFSGSGSAPLTNAVTDAWRAMPAAAVSGRPVTYSFDMTAIQASLPYAFHLKTLPFAGKLASLVLSVNGQDVKERHFRSGDDVYWFIPAADWTAGANTLTLTLKSRYDIAGLAASVPFDWMELSGSWQVGNVDNTQKEFANENDAPDDFYVTDSNWMHLERAIIGREDSETNTVIHFTLSPELADSYTFTYDTKVISQGTGCAGKFPVALFINGQLMYATNGVPDGTPVAIPLAPGLLHSGDNSINWTATGTGLTDPWFQFDFHRLAIQQPAEKPATDFIVIW
jgi:hypothetical protein